MKRYLILFKSTRAVITAERLLKRKKMECTILPVPRSISSECGMALEIDCDDQETVERLCSRNGISTSFYVWEK